jgi:hypothetical protein
MPRTIERPEAKQPVPAPDRQEVPHRIIVHDPDRPRGIERWVRWMAIGIIVVAVVVVALWAALPEGEETVTADYPDCWPLCSYAAATPVVGSAIEATPAEYPDCWPLCSYAAQASAAPADLPTVTAASGRPACAPLCEYALQPTEYPNCWPLCSYASQPTD